MVINQLKLFKFICTLERNDSKMVNKKIVIISTIIALFLVVLVVAIQIKKLYDVQYTTEETNTTTKSNIVEEQNIIENKTETETNNIANENNNTTIKEEQTVQNEPPKQENQTQGEEEKNSKDEVNGSDKALELVKKEWGEDDTVYYTIDNQSNNIYIISVRSKSSTAVLTEYEVNIEKETVVVK